MTATPRPLPRPQAPVLLVTSNRHFAARCANVLVRELVGLDLSCEHVLDGEDAWALCHERVPRLVYCALDLAGMNGLELVALLRQNPATSTVPICVVASRPLLPGDRALLERLGVRHVIAPTVPDARLAAIAAEALI